MHLALLERFATRHPLFIRIFNANVHTMRSAVGVCVIALRKWLTAWLLPRFLRGFNANLRSYI